jgi:predicted esterase
MALMTSIFIAMGQLNHAIHFYIYTLTGGVFRNELIQLFTWKKKKSFANRQQNTEQTLLQSQQIKNNNNNHQIDLHGF